MNWFTSALSSSLGKKFVMGITGLLLCGFLVVHLAGNLLLYAGENDKGEHRFSEYAHALHSQEGLVKVAELGLAALFALHIYLAVVTSRDNRAARGGRGYAVQQSKIDGGPVRSDTWMFASGAVVLGFLILHLSDFTFQLRGEEYYLTEDAVEKEPYEIVTGLIKTPLSAVVYLIGTIVLGFHLAHGVSSAFQSLGINHPRYNQCIRWAGVIFAVVIAGGFASIPIYFMIQ